MNEDKKGQVDTETILLTLDQIGQTIDIMTNVVGRLRGYITEHVEKQGRRDKINLNTAEESGPHTLH